MAGIFLYYCSAQRPSVCNAAAHEKKMAIEAHTIESLIHDRKMSLVVISQGVCS